MTRFLQGKSARIFFFFFFFFFFFLIWLDTFNLKCIWQSFFFICSIKSPQCTDKYTKTISDRDFSSPCFDVPKTWNFISGGHKTARPKETGNDCDVMSSVAENRFLRHFLFSYKQHTFVPFLSEIVSPQSENKWEIRSFLFLVSRFYTTPEVRLRFLVYKNTEKKNRYRISFAILINKL